ncbi:sulfur carrier protein ThiS [Texcoconibacillus texcoconensis]|uniref:Sulfur carrier protein n=1 Tax=Texcoconibacillus texcoconensis TaxID=1095777 RepID=A0A840QLR1_9BACI|nr:sulfur carrier protein ThiS [Texcoconibacillus texcoconensis]MBB5172291.1 sulfur carrier protein [Texcoconibacillus texcoconensis]
MILHVNGKEKTLPDQIQSVDDVLHHYSLDQKAVIVELNEEIVERASLKEQSIKDGDRIEIVQFVGGG